MTTISSRAKAACQKRLDDLIAARVEAIGSGPESCAIIAKELNTGDNAGLPRRGHDYTARTIQRWVAKMSAPRMHKTQAISHDKLIKLIKKGLSLVKEGTKLRLLPTWAKVAKWLNDQGIKHRMKDGDFEPWTSHTLSDYWSHHAPVEDRERCRKHLKPSPHQHRDNPKQTSFPTTEASDIPDQNEPAPDEQCVEAVGGEAAAQALRDDWPSLHQLQLGDVSLHGTVSPQDHRVVTLQVFLGYHPSSSKELLKRRISALYAAVINAVRAL